MARWDNENFNNIEPPKDILCYSCKYKLKPITIGGYTQERYGYASCEKFDDKPQEYLWKDVPCPYYVKE